MEYLDIALLLIRLAVGLIFVGHGAQKLFGWFGGPGIEGTTGMMEHLGVEPARLWAWVTGLSEFLGGLGLALGLLTPLAAVALFGAMLVAIFKVHWPAFWNSDNGMEFPLVLGVASFAIGLSGAGLFSLDYLLGLPLQAPGAFAIAVAFTLVAVGWVLAQGRDERGTVEEQAA